MNDIEQDYINKQNYFGQIRDEILYLIYNNLLTTNFQAIYDAKNGEVFGYEALTRTKVNFNKGIENLFKKAIETKTISLLELKCRENAITLANEINIISRDNFLFLNLTPDVLLDPTHNIGFTDRILEKFSIPKDRIVFEITEESAIKNFDLFNEAVRYYRKRGYKIAIDDFGAGYGGLKMLSIIEPDFLKIDKHFISRVHETPIKQNIIDSIVIVSHKMGTRVISEGIETRYELKTVLELNVDFLQGYFLQKPSENPNKEPVKYGVLLNINNDFDFTEIGSIVRFISPIKATDSHKIVYERFIKYPDLRSIPVVQNEEIVGSVLKNFYLNNIILKTNMYGMPLNANERVSDIMIMPSLIVEADTLIESVSQRIIFREPEFLYDDIYVTKNGKYFGLVPVYVLLDAIQKRHRICKSCKYPNLNL